LAPVRSSALMPGRLVGEVLLPGRDSGASGAAPGEVSGAASSRKGVSISGHLQVVGGGLSSVHLHAT